MNPFVIAIIVCALMVVPFLLGGYFARALRMPDYDWKIGIILWTLICSLVILTTKWPPKLGIDLSGGMILIYDVDKSQLKAGQSPDMDKVVGAITKRINPGGVKEISTRKYGSDGVQIIIPDVDEAAANRVAEMVSRVGTLEFRILANTTDNKALIEMAKSEPNQNVILDSENKREAWWVPVWEGKEGEFLRSQDIAVRMREVGAKKVTEVLVAQDNYDVTGEYLDHAGEGNDESGRIAVEFTFNSKGGRLFGMLTGDNKPDQVSGFKRRLGIILDGKLFSAPGLESQIFDRGIIRGDFTKEQVNQQVEVLNAGALPATLNKEPISKLYCGPTLGKDTIRKSTISLIVAIVIVPLFMLWYYRFPGMIADIALAINIVVLLAIMIAVKAAFTLPGFAGFALTVGMAVDNNVLVFERLREELARGAALRMAIRNAFQRASATIIDCNITHLISAVVLYAIAPEQVKSFAVTLFLGVTISMFTSVFMARVLFDIAEKHRWITELNMRHLVGHTEIDFMGWFPYCLTFSILITVLGLAVAFMRGPGLFDIDFTGGTSVQVLFNKSQNIADVRSTLEKLPQFPDVTISEVSVSKEETNVRFDVNTSNSDINQVKEELIKAFPGQLKVNEMEVAKISPISAEKGESRAPGKESPGDKPAEKAVEKTPEKPVEQPEEKSTEKAVEKTTEQPAEKNRLEAAPADQPTQPAKPADSGEKKQTWRRTGTKSLMAMATAVPLLFGQVDAAAGAQPDSAPVARQAANSAAPPAGEQPVAEKPVAEKPSAEKPVEEKPSTEKPAEEKPSVEKPVEEKPSAEKPVEEKPSAEKPAVEKPAAEKPAGETGVTPKITTPVISDPYAGGTEAHVSFVEKLDQATLQDLLKASFQTLKLGDRVIALDAVAANEKFQPVEGFEEGSKTPYQHWIVKIALPADKVQESFAALKAKLAQSPYFPASNAIGGAVAVATRYQAIYALVASWVLIILYLWIRFQGVAFGLAAVIALIHDVLVMLGGIAFSYYLAPYFGWLYIDPFKINLPIIAAFLTIIGYSVNDTIVVFDRIREVRGKDPNMTAEMVNLSTNQTLSRTLLTSLTVFMVVVVLYFFAGEALRGLSFALIVGVITGTYSSIYVAAPILLWLIGKGKN